MPNHDRLAYELLADSLSDRNLVGADALAHILGQCLRSGGLFPAILVREGLVSDWELSRVACDVFGLPFLPLEVVTPSSDLVEVLDAGFIRQHCVVPLDRFGDLMTIAMPGMVEGVVLREIEKLLNVQVKPIVSSVDSNMRWIEANIETPELTMPEGHHVARAFSNAGVDVSNNGVEPQHPSQLVAEEAEVRQVLEVREEELENSLQMFDLVEEEEAFAAETEEEAIGLDEGIDDALLESDDFLGLGDLNDLGSEDAA